MLALTAVLAFGVFGASDPEVVDHPQMRPLRLVTIDVAGDPAYNVPPHQIEIDSTAPALNPTPEALAEREWTATRRMNDLVQTISSASCPALKAVALSFSELPDVPIRPVVSQVGGRFPNGPTLRDGYATTLTFDTVTTDNAMVSVRISGWGVFQSWGHESVAALVPCWPRA